MPASPREQTLGRIEHPDPLRLDTGRELELVVDPACDRLTKGDGLLGWEGDERLALYIDRRSGTWDLFRLEHDGWYRGVMQLPGLLWRGPDVIGEMVLRLLATDTRRGVDPMAALEANRAEMAAAEAEKQAELVEETAGRLASALAKDGVT